MTPEELLARIEQLLEQAKPLGRPKLVQLLDRARQELAELGAQGKEQLAAEPLSTMKRPVRAKKV